MNTVSVVVEPIATHQLKVYYQNYLESGILTVTSENTSFPNYRLYDRAQGLLFKATSHPNPFDIKIDLGASGPYPTIDTLILGKNHNLAGLTLTLAYSDNDADYTTAASWVCAAAINLQPFTGVQHRYWKLSIASPSSDPEIGELFLSKVLSFERNPNWDYGYGRLKKINRLESQAGYTQKTKWADMRKRRRYHLTKMDSNQRIDIETFEDVTESIKNFYIEDLQGNLFFAELPDPLPEFVAEQGGRWGLDFSVQEALD
jgi:hypothetical protein